jgi:PKD repeat protein
MARTAAAIAGILLCATIAAATPAGAAAPRGHHQARALPACTKGFAADSCSVTARTATSITISYSLTYIYPQCSGGVTSGCVYQLFIQLGSSGWGTFAPSVTNTCPGRSPFSGSGTYVAEYDYPLPAGTSITCTAKFTWPQGQFGHGFSVNATELDGEAITLANSDHDSSTVLPAPPPVASFTFKRVTGEPGSVEFTDTSTTMSGQPLTEAWAASDGDAGTGATWEHAFDGSGTYTVDLTVTDVIDQSDSTSQEVVIVYPPGSAASATITVREALVPAGDPGRFDLLVNGAVVARIARNGIAAIAHVRPGHYAVSQLARTVGLTYYGVAVSCTKDGKRDVRAAATLVHVAVTSRVREICTFTDTRTPQRHCDVPALAGVPFAAAHHDLVVADCALGKVTVAGSPGVGKVLRIRSSAPGAFAVVAAGTKVSLALVYEH